MKDIKKTLLSTKRGKAEIVCLIVYVIGIILIGSFHELWFDEAQSWQIARSAPYKDILFNIPHYEGHPQLWHLLLSIFAKNGAPYEFTLKAINYVFSASAMAVLLFKSPFPKVVRCGLPFTYYFFYRYGINCRPYSMTMLAMFLAATFYKERNEHPWRYILSLTFLCFTTAYGILLAGGLCIVWTFEIISDAVKNKTASHLIKDSRTYSLVFILAAALFLVMSIIPADDAFYGGCMQEGSRLLSVFNYITALIIPLDCWLTNYALLVVKDNIFASVISAILGVLTWFLLITVTKKNKKLFVFFVPFIMMVGFMAFKYCSEYHFGIGSAFHVFIFWIILDENKKIELPDFFGRIYSKINSQFLKKALPIFGITICTIPFYYTAAASVNDIKYWYGSGIFVNFIKENHIENKKIMIMWPYLEEDNENREVDLNEAKKMKDLLTQLEIPSEHGKIKSNFTYLSGLGSTLLPYFDSNIFMNFNADCPEDLYMHYKYKEDEKKIMKLWEEKGLPDFIFDYAPIDEVYDDVTLESVKYLPVAEYFSVRINKDSLDENKHLVYMREDLFPEYPQLKWIYDPKADLYEIKK